MIDIMSELQLLIDVLMRCMTMQFTVFGCTLSLFSVFIGLSLISLVIYAIVKLYN